MPYRAPAPITSEASVAINTCWAPEARARSATRTTIGLPPRSASGLPGRREEASRAGTTAMKDTGLSATFRYPSQAQRGWGKARESAAVGIDQGAFDCLAGFVG